MRPAMLFAVLCSLTACGGTTGLTQLPAGPSELAGGVVLYEGANFAGSSAHVASDIPNLGDFDGPCEHTGDYDVIFHDWNDCVSSFRVAPGWRATVYEERDYKGESYMTTGDTGNLQLVRGTCSHDGLNDCVSSVRVVRVE
jgi:hypothetical protein